MSGFLLGFLVDFGLFQSGSLTDLCLIEHTGIVRSELVAN